MDDASTALLILGAVIVVFVINRIPVAIVALGTALALWATGLLTLNEALAGFGEPVVVFIAALFVVSEAIDASGLTAWAGSRILSIAGEGHARLLIAIMALCAVLTALVSLNGSVAALLPLVVMVSMRLGRPPSRMLMPMAYAGSAGSLLVLMGSPVNIIVSDAARDAGEGAFGFFEFAIIGAPILIVTIVAGFLLSERVLPDRTPETVVPDLSRHAEMLAAHYDLRDGFYRLRVRDQSSLIGKASKSLDHAGHPELEITAVQSAAGHPVDRPIEAGDTLVATGPSAQISALAVEARLAVAMRPLPAAEPGALVSREAGVAEIVIPPRSERIGEEMFPGMVRAEDLVILSIQRHGRSLGDQPVTLISGDSLLVYGAWPAIDALAKERDVLVVGSPDLMRRQAAPLGPQAIRTAIIVGAMVTLLALGLVPPAVAGLLAVMALVLTGTLTSPQALRSVSWETVILIGGLIPLSAAIQQSGAADDIADVVVDVVGNRSPIILMVVLFVLTSILGLVISNTATVLIALPIALATAQETGISARPILMLIAVAGSAALLTPIQTPGNMMIMAPAGYRFSDYCRLGLPLLVLWLALALLIIPLAWPFTP